MSRMCGLELKAQLRRNQEWWKLSFTSHEHQKGSRLFQSTKSISRICDSAWTLICMVVNFHGCELCVWESYRVPLQQGFDRMTSCGFALIECQRLLMSLLFDQDESTVSWERGKLSWIMSTSLLCWRKKMLKAVMDFFPVSCTECMMALFAANFSWAWQKWT